MEPPTWVIQQSMKAVGVRPKVEADVKDWRIQKSLIGAAEVDDPVTSVACEEMPSIEVRPWWRRMWLWLVQR